VYAGAQITLRGGFTIDSSHSDNWRTNTMNRINKISVSLLAVLLLTIVGCAGSETQESTGEYIDDTWITTKVKTELVKSDIVKSREVNVETFKGIVQLSGFVSSQVAMDEAVRIARNIKGVESVRNDMRIK
jgi:osmotically-inducible protein OsmY